MGKRIFRYTTKLVRESSQIYEVENKQITDSTTAMEFCRRVFGQILQDSPTEKMVVIPLNTKNIVIGYEIITSGTLDSSLVHPREIFRPAILANASGILLCHNHPSGDSTPSPQDISATRRLDKSAEILGIDIVDHIVVGACPEDAAHSIREIM